MSQTLDQQRAAFVWTKLSDLHQKQPAVFDAYTKLSKGAGTLIMQNGLMPTIAFYQAKAREHEWLLAHLLAWLKLRGFHQCSTVPAVLEAFTKLNTMQYRDATEESLALIRWIRHFASALNKTE